MSTQVNRTVHVWEISIRIFHILFALSVVGALISSLRENWLAYHASFGLAALSLVVFRIGYGFVGDTHARFSSFLRPPGQVIRFALRLIKGRNHPPDGQEGPGHNPVAGMVMVAMLLAVLLMGVSGVVVLGGQEQIAPWAAWFSAGLAAVAAWAHLLLAFFVMGLIALHLLGIILHTRRTGEAVAMAMVDGRRYGAGQPAQPILAPVVPRVRLALVAGCLLLAGSLFSTLPFQYTSRQTVEALAARGESTTQPSLVGVAHAAIGNAWKGLSQEDKLWRKECGGCHLAFHPVLLPGNSWLVMMSELDNHFGDNAWLDDETGAKLMGYAVAHSADGRGTEAARGIVDDLAQGDAPQRITQTAFWEERHHGISAEDFQTAPARGPLDCKACHPHAEYGSFEDEHIRFPFQHREGINSGLPQKVNSKG